MQLRYVILPLLFLSYGYLWFQVIKNFKEDWKDNEEDSWRQWFFMIHVIIVAMAVLVIVISGVGIGIEYLIPIIKENW